MFYLAYVHREGQNWLAEFPDAPGCQTFAESREALQTDAQEALEGWLEAHLVGGEAPPHPRAKHPRIEGREQLKVCVAPSLAAALEVRWARHARGWSQSELAQHVGVTQQQIAKIENPDENPTIKTIEKVACALGMELHLTFARAAVA